MPDKYAHIKANLRKQRKLEKMCLNKVVYETPEEATANGSDGYKCPNCGKYHSTQRMKRFLKKYKKMKSKKLTYKDDEWWTFERNQERLKLLNKEMHEVSVEMGMIDKKISSLKRRITKEEKEKEKLAKKMSHNQKYKNRLVDKIHKELNC